MPVSQDQRVSYIRFPKSRPSDEDLDQSDFVGGIPRKTSIEKRKRIRKKVR